MRIGRGKPLDEARGSLNDYTSSCARAFYQTFPDSEREMFWMRDIYADHVVVEATLLPPGHFYKINYQVAETDGSLAFAFASRLEWAEVELDYVPAEPVKLPKMPVSASAAGAGNTDTATPPDAQTASKTDKRPDRRFVETFNSVTGALSEDASKPGNKRLTIGEAIRADEVNLNNRRYPRAVLQAAVAEIVASSKLRESAGQGRLILRTPEGAPLVGEADHPSDKGKRAQVIETVVAWDRIEFNDTTGAVSISGLVANTTYGREILALAEVGVLPGGSLRGYGVSHIVDDGDSQVEEVLELHITGYDLVLTPAFPNGHTTVLESRKAEENDNMGLEAFLAALRANPTLAQQVKEALGVENIDAISEAQMRMWENRMKTALSLTDSDDLISKVREGLEASKQLADQKRAAAIAEAITAHTADLNYGAELNAQFVAAVKAQPFADAAEVKPFCDAKRTEYGAIAASLKLKGMGKGDTGAARKSVVTVLGPVIESETGTPEYATAAHAIAAKLLAARPSEMKAWKEAAPANVNQEFAVKVLKAYDQRHQADLLRESQMFAEVSQASDLALPNSIIRAIIARAVPQFIATSVFTTGVMNGPTDQWWYRQFTEETGMTKTITDELVAVPASLTGGVELSLAHQRLVKGTVVLTNNAASVTYTEGTDYAIDYANGKIFLPATSTVPTAANAKIDYNYTAIREGEDQAIMRGKIGLTSKTMTAKADRLATKITQEAIVFGRAAMGMDVAVETLADLVVEIRRRQDSGIINTASYAIMKGLNSASVGTFDLSDALADVTKVQNLINYVGLARQKIRQRYYSADSILMSEALADQAANWSGFTAAGKRPDTDLTSEGFVGRIKNIPVFATTEMGDDMVMVFNKELAGYFVQNPMELKGPYPTYKDVSGELHLVADEQYYVQEFNATDAPVGEKGAWIKVQA